MIIIIIMIPTTVAAKRTLCAPFGGGAEKLRTPGLDATDRWFAFYIFFAIKKLHFFCSPHPTDGGAARNVKREGGS